MTASHLIDSRRGLVVARFSGPIDHDDVMAWLDALRADPAFDRRHAVVVDLRRASFSQTRPEKAEAIARHMVDTAFSTGRWALLVTGPLETALSMLYQDIAAAHHPVQVCSTAAAAARFLGHDLGRYAL